MKSVNLDGFLKPKLGKLPKDLDNSVINCDIGHQNLDNLENCPKLVTGNFQCHYNNLKSLKYGPTHVGMQYNCIGNNELDSIQDIAIYIGGNLVLPGHACVIFDMWKLPYLTHIKGNIFINSDISELLNKYKNGVKAAAFDLQRELIEFAENNPQMVYHHSK